MDAFPAFYPLAGRKVVVVGAGEAADNKARLFDGSPASLVRLSVEQALAPGAFDGAALVFIASEDEAFIVEAARAARRAGAAVKVVAVGATGAAPLLAAMLRNDIEAQVPEGAGRVAILFRSTRDEVRAALPDIGDRRAFLREALTGPAAQAAMAGDMDAALTRMREAIAALSSGPAVKPMGRVDFIVGEGPADLLSLRAARALSQADVLIVDPRLPPEIVAMARRDAHRAPFADSATLKLVELAGEGLRVVCALPGPLDPSIPRTLGLTGAGVAVLQQAPA